MVSNHNNENSRNICNICECLQFCKITATFPNETAKSTDWLWIGPVVAFRVTVTCVIAAHIQQGFRRALRWKMDKCHLPTKMIAIDRTKQFPNFLHDRGGELFCTLWNIVVNHKKQSSLDNHFSTLKHKKLSAMNKQLREISVAKEACGWISFC